MYVAWWVMERGGGVSGIRLDQLSSVKGGGGGGAGEGVGVGVLGRERGGNDAVKSAYSGI